jgi:hypothetical protein
MRSVVKSIISHQKKVISTTIRTQNSPHRQYHQSQGTAQPRASNLQVPSPPNPPLGPCRQSPTQPQPSVPSSNMKNPQPPTQNTNLTLNRHPV